METSDKLYSNILMMAPNGEQLCRVSARRAKWYVDKGIAVLEGNKLTLKFEPNGYAVGDEAFYVGEKENLCVVCGDEDSLTKHHIVPTCFRRHFPAEYKSHLSHDVLLVCEACHEAYEYHAYQKKTVI